ncbi:MAG: hypothetical protein IKX02_01970 [Spirochaetales bacterium]|nr:hypothetical protein [Spirochaetales bacterium]
MVDGRKYVSPAYYQADSNYPNDYLELLPDQKLGNYCFFWSLDPEKYEFVPRRPGIIHSPVALIFWFDTREVFQASNCRDLESLKLSILKVVSRDLRLSKGRLSVHKIYNHGPNIFKEFTLDEIDSQALLHPYAGLRFEGEITFDEPC